MKASWFLLAGFLLLGLLFWAMKPTPVAVPSPSAATADLPTLPPSGPIAQRIALEVRDGHLVSGPARISVPAGTPLTLQITSDHADELHLHGYDLTLTLQAGVPAELSWVADRSGRFEYELHHHHTALGVLEVQPQ
jgi:hypothetical protein